MKQVYIVHENHPKLLLLFAGWQRMKPLSSNTVPKGWTIWFATTTEHSI